MAVYKIFPSKDATIYSGYPSLNTGLDEIIEATTNFLTGSLKTDGGNPQTSRILIQFSNDDISYVTSSLATGSFQANLKLFVANSTGLSTDTTVIVNALSQSWDMGTGKYLNNPETQNGASWISASIYNGWVTTYAPGSTGSFSTSGEAGGGVWFTGSETSQTFSYKSDLDINFNVTNIVQHWTGSSPEWVNNGFIIRQSGSQEFVDNINQQVTLKYFSADTHTIYPPYLEFKWVDYNRNTLSSIGEISTSELYASLAENPGTFYSESINRFRINCRPIYPTRVWQTSSLYTTQHYLPTASYYAIKDLDTNEFVIDFDTTYTQISADTTSSYFDLYMNGLEPERYYKVLIQTTINGSTKILDDNYYFKVING